MVTRPSRWLVGELVVALLAGLLMMGSGACAQEKGKPQEETPKKTKIQPAVKKAPAAKVEKGEAPEKAGAQPVVKKAPAGKLEKGETPKKAKVQPAVKKVPAAKVEKGKAPVGEIPKKVMSALKAKFPNARVQKWTKETEDNIVVYDFELTQDGRKFEADIREDGSIHNWEEQITVKDLPEAVRRTVTTEYPKATIKEIMRITAVKAGKDVLEGYEVVLQTADKKTVEVTVAPNGKILE